jgi:hypothetical protein
MAVGAIWWQPRGRNNSLSREQVLGLLLHASIDAAV